MNRLINLDNIFLKIWNCAVCRIGLILFTIVLILLFLLSALANPILNWIVKPQIVNTVNKNGKANLHIDFLDYSLFQNRLISYKTFLTITDSTQLSKDSINIIVPYFSVSGINWINLLFGSGYSLSDTVTKEPEIRIKSYNYSKNNSQKNTSTRDTINSSDSTLAQQLAKFLPDGLNPLRIGTITIHSANIVRTIQAEHKTIDSIKIYL